MKSVRGYEELFKTFMEYTPYTNVSQVTDLNEFFNKVDSHPATKNKRKKPVFGGQRNVKLREAMADTFHRLKGRGDTTPRKALQPEMHEARSRSYADASSRDATIVAVTFRKGKEVPVRVYRDRQGKWRDHKGRRTRVYIEL